MNNAPITVLPVGDDPADTKRMQEVLAGSKDCLFSIEWVTTRSAALALGPGWKRIAACFLCIRCKCNRAGIEPIQAHALRVSAATQKRAGLSAGCAYK